MSKQQLHCLLCDAHFSIPTAQPGTEDDNIKTLPGQLFEWLNELRFIGKYPGYAAGPRFRAQSLEARLEYVCEIEDSAVYRLPEDDLNKIDQIPEGSYSFHGGESNGLDIVLFPIHAKCIELLQRLRAAYNVSQDDTLRALEMNHWHEAPEEEAESFLCANPITIPTLTNHILFLLQPAAVTSLHHQYNQRSPSPKLSSLVCYANYDRHHLHHHHDNIHSHSQQEEQQIYRESLISGSAVPYLWDLDKEVCRKKDQQGSNQTWDWKGLVEELFRSQGVWGDAPLGLRNRCRIWESTRQRFAQLGYYVGAR